jgi:hypothetical protein
MTASIAAGRAEKARMFERWDVRVRAGAPPGEKRRGETARLADALNGIGCADERTHKDVRGRKAFHGWLLATCCSLSRAGALLHPKGK